MPHGYCLRWDPALITTMVTSNIAIAIAYFAIPAALWHFVRHRKDVPYRWMFRLFGLFIVACGITHLMKVWTLYKAFYWPEAFADSFTAIVSLLTAALLWPLIPKALALKSPLELKEAHDKLQESEERFRLLLSGVKDYAIFMLDPDGIVKTWNYGAQKMSGYTPDEIIGNHFSILYSEQEKIEGKPEKDLDIALKSGRYEEEEGQRIPKGGGQFWANVVLVPLLDNLGELTGFANVIRDITERKQITDKLREQADLLNLTHDAVIVRELDGTITYWNNGAKRMYGFSEEDAIGKTTHSLLTTRFAQPFSHIQETILNKGYWEGELLHTTKDGRRLIVSSRHALKCDTQNKPIGVLEINTDLTEHKQAEQRQLALAEMKRVNTELEQFTYVASHDLQEPLRAIAGCLQILEKTYKGKLDDNADELIHHATDGAERMRRLISDLLALAHVNGGDVVLERLNMSELLEQSLKNLEARIKDTNAVITQDPLPVVTGEKTQLIQLLQNLIGNALKFCKDSPPEIRITATRLDNRWQIGVHDNGIGFEKEFAEKIFQPFKRLHSREQYSGTGIGLAICKRIVERHGGNIWADSHADQGASFYFTIADLEQPQ